MAKKRGAKKVNGKEQYVKLTPEIKEAMKFLKMCRGMNEHHIQAVSRDGKDEGSNKKNVSAKFHTLYHAMFDLMNPEEAEFFLVFWLRGRKKTWSSKDLIELRTLIMEGKIEEAMKLSQFCYKQQDELVRKFIGIIEKRQAKKITEGGDARLKSCAC